MIKGLLVIIPCGKGKIWDTYPTMKQVPAKDAYTGSPFKVNRDYAEKFAEKWVILSAKYGYISPETFIEDYDITFKDLRTNPISVSHLKQQVQERKLNEFPEIIGLGGIEYRERIRDSFEGTGITIQFPFENSGGIGKMMSMTKSATVSGKRVPDNLDNL